MNPRLISDRFPYLLLHVRFGSQGQDVEVLIDTGFDGDLVLPARLIPPGRLPIAQTGRWRLADGSTVESTEYPVTVGFGAVGTVAALASVLGDEPLVGLGLIELFVVTFIRGQQVIVEA